MAHARRHHAGVCSRRARARRLNLPWGGTPKDVLVPADNALGEVVMSSGVVEDTGKRPESGQAQLLRLFPQLDPHLGVRRVLDQVTCLCLLVVAQELGHALLGHDGGLLE
jgi:hypothetical protein